MAFHEYPYTDFHEMNLDWVIAKVKELTLAWAQTSSDWEELRTFVNDYFANLDVQEEINSKMDELVRDGTLSSLIAPYVTSGLPAEVANQIAGVVAQQIGAVVAAQLPAQVTEQIPGAVAGEAANWLSEHVDPSTGYVVDDTLTIQGAAADAKAAGDRIARLNESLVNSDGGNVECSSINYITDDNLIRGHYLTPNDTPTESNSFDYTDYINIENLKYLIYDGNAGNNLILFYDANKQKLAYSPDRTLNGISGQTPSQTIPEGAVYTRFNVVADTVGSAKFYVIADRKTISIKQITGYVEKKEIDITLGVNYNTLESAITYANGIANENNIVNILIPEGEYDAFDGINLSQQSADFIGLVLNDYVNITGIGYNNKVILKGELPVDMAGYAYSRENVSVLNCWKNNSIKNLTIESKNMRYSIHNDDYVVNAINNAREVFEDLILVSKLDAGVQSNSSIPMGIGAINGRKTNIRRCKFINQAGTFSAIICHNNLNSNNICVWNMEECLFRGGSYSLHILSNGNADKFDIISVIGCKFENKIRFQSQDNASTKSQVVLYGTGNELHGFAYVGIIENSGEKDMLIT